MSILHIFVFAMVALLILILISHFFYQTPETTICHTCKEKALMSDFENAEKDVLVVEADDTDTDSDVSESDER